VIYGVVLAGGRGERFWPLSRRDRPKQFLKLTSDKTMLDQTIDRVRPLIPKENIRIVTNQAMSQFIKSSIDDIDDHHIIAEPEGRNTCLAIGLAAVHLKKTDPAAVMVVLSADHLIRPAARLLSIIEAGADIASVEDRLLTIGIVPTRPETGYGYIQVGDLYRADAEQAVYEVQAFKEKPKVAIASQYFYSQNYLWNSGMFIWSADSILGAMKRYQPEMWALLEEYEKHIGSGREETARAEMYKRATSISIDFAVLEQADNVLTIKGEIVWDDIGNWRALERYKHKDQENNVVVGNATVVKSYDVTVYNECDGLIACFGVSDLVIVRSGDITMVAHRTQVENVKELLAVLADDEATTKYL